MAKAKVVVDTTKDTLAQKLQESLNAKFKGTKVAYFLGGDVWSPTDLNEWIGTGSSTLDLAISNRPNGGFPVGRIIEITGLEASGKSLLAAHALANTQKAGGVGVFIDTENAVSEDFLAAIGVDIENLLYVQLDTVEDIYDAITNIVTNIRETSKDRLVTIVVDSMAAASTKIELAADFDKDGWATSKAIINSKAMRKITQLIGRQRICLIFTNQLREKLGVMFGDPYTTSGGHALKFHASVRLRLKGMGQIKAKDPISGIEQTIGIKTQVQVIKNRCGPPLRKTIFDIYFSSGIDDTGGWLQVLKDYKLVKTAGAWYTYVDTETGEEIKFQSKDFETLIIARPELKQRVYEQICEVLISAYSAKNIGIDDVTIDEHDPIPEG